MVEKQGGWRMCIDFMDLNKAYLRDCYPLLPIDQKIELVVGYNLLSFLNLNKGYHQIHMDCEDAPKTTFIIG